jgi:hypothetical protein
MLENNAEVDELQGKKRLQSNIKCDVIYTGVQQSKKNSKKHLIRYVSVWESCLK